LLFTKTLTNTKTDVEKLIEDVREREILFQCIYEKGKQGRRGSGGSRPAVSGRGQPLPLPLLSPTLPFSLSPPFLFFSLSPNPDREFGEAL